MIGLDDPARETALVRIHSLIEAAPEVNEVIQQYYRQEDFTMIYSWFVDAINQTAKRTESLVLLQSSPSMLRRVKAKKKRQGALKAGSYIAICSYAFPTIFWFRVSRFIYCR